MIVTFDTEGTTHNKGNPFTASNRLVAYSVKVNNEPTVFSYYNDIDFPSALRHGLAMAKMVVGFNIKYDLHVVRRHLHLYPLPGTRIWDCQLAEFIISGQKMVMPSLNECLAKYGLGQKDDKIAEYWAIGVSTFDIPVDELKVYNMLDVDLTYKLYLKQQEVMTEKQKKLCLVQGLDLLVLADMEWNGVKFDIDLCRERADETEKELQTITEELHQYCPTPLLNLDSGHQLSCLLFGGGFQLTVVDSVEELVYKTGPRKGETYLRNRYRTDTFHCPGMFTPLKGSQTKLVSKAEGKEYPVYATGEDVLKQLKRPTSQHKRIIELLLRRAELAKLLDTYYGKLPLMLEKMEWGDILHGQYNQCVAATGRLSSSNPNMQNFSGDADKLLVSRYDS